MLILQKWDSLDVNRESIKFHEKTNDCGLTEITKDLAKSLKVIQNLKNVVKNIEVVLRVKINKRSKILIRKTLEKIAENAQDCLEGKEEKFAQKPATRFLQNLRR